MIISLIAAISENNVIGKENKLVWNIPTDTEYYKRTIRKKPIIMGRKTAESEDMYFSENKNILITRQENYQRKGFEVVGNLDDAISLCKGEEEVFITGGSEVYRMAMPMAHKLYITRVHETFTGDAFFPEINTLLWEATSEHHFNADEVNEHSFSILIYQRKQSI